MSPLPRLTKPGSIAIGSLEVAWLQKVSKTHLMEESSYRCLEQREDLPRLKGLALKDKRSYVKGVV